MSERSYRSMRASDEQIVEYIDAYCREKGFSPSLREIRDQFGYKTASAIHNRLTRLRKRGLIAYEPFMPRTVRVVRHEEGE